MTESTENVNIYLNSKEKRDDVLGTATPQEKYIIIMNDSLNYKNKELECHIHDLEAQIEVFEEDTNRMEKGRTYMKGLLKNFVEIHNWYKTITEKQGNISTNRKFDFTKFKRKATKHLRYLQTVMILFLAVWYEYHKFIDFFPILSIFALIAAFQESTLWNLRFPEYIEDKNTISALMEEINKANAAQDYIHILIDEQ